MNGKNNISRCNLKVFISTAYLLFRIIEFPFQAVLSEIKNLRETGNSFLYIN